MGEDHIQEMRAKMEREKTQKPMNNPTSDQIYQNLASKVLTLLLERDRAKNVTTERDRAKNVTTENIKKQITEKSDRALNE